MNGTLVRLVSVASALTATLVLLPHAAGAQKSAERELTRSEQAAHALSRIAFGARPGDVERVLRIGVDRWIEQQLNPGALSEQAAVDALASFRSWTVEARGLAAAHQPGEQRPAEALFEEMLMAQSGGAVKPARQKAPPNFTTPANEFTAGKIIRAQLSERQLEEVMVDFWLNHFSVYSAKMPSTDAIVIYERDVIRPRALGKFRDLIGAVAHSPAMLHYLDNSQSRSDSLHRSLAEYRSGAAPSARPAAVRRLGINENYARELLELHSLGVDAGYTQQDVIEVARAFTGWTTTVTRATPPAGAARTTSAFSFAEDMHDAESKLVLGHILEAGRGVEDGEQVLDIVSRHPSTARYIATKLARRFVSDVPPESLVERAAAAFSSTDGDITATLRTILTSPEFFSRTAFRSKVKSPFEFVVSLRRAVNAPADTSLESARVVAQFGQPTFGRITPDGWPDDASKWMTGFALLDRILFVQDATAGKLKYLPTAGWDGWKKYSGKSAKVQADAVIAGLLGGIASPETREFMLAVPEQPVMTGGSQASARLRALVTIALASPEFQRR